MPIHPICSFTPSAHYPIRPILPIHPIHSHSVSTIFSVGDGFAVAATIPFEMAGLLPTLPQNKAAQSISPVQL